MAHRILITGAIHQSGRQLLAAQPDIEVDYRHDLPHAEILTIIGDYDCVLSRSETTVDRAMIDAGAAVALATDLNPGSAPCYSQPLVMAVAARYLHMLPAEALTAATVNAAHAIGLGAQVGSLDVGKQADLLILKVADYCHVAYFIGGNPVATVIVRGEVVA